MKPRVFVVQPVPERVLDILREAAEVEVYPHRDRQITVEDLKAAVARNDYVLAMHETLIPREVLLANPNLRGIAIYNRWMGFDETIDLAACDELGIPLLENGLEAAVAQRRAIGKATADLAVGHILCLAYRIPEADAYTRAGNFRQEQTSDLLGVGCTGKVAGFIGFGRIGKYMAERLRAFEMELLYTKRTRLSPVEEAAWGVTWVDGKDEVLRRSDFVCLVASDNESTRRMIGERELHLMKSTAFLINPGRGRLVDEPALIRALEDGRIAGAGLDVYWNEPPEAPEPDVPEALRRLPNVILAPHNGGATWTAREIQGGNQARNIVAHIRGEYVAPTITAEDVIAATGA